MHNKHLDHHNEDRLIPIGKECKEQFIVIIREVVVTIKILLTIEMNTYDNALTSNSSATSDGIRTNAGTCKTVIMVAMV